jgi:hypothetical protein
MSAQKLVSDLVLRTTLLSFVGPSISEDVDFQHAVQGYSRHVRDTVLLLLLVPRFARPLLAPILPSTFGIRALHAYLRRRLFAEVDRSMPTVLQHYIATSKPLDEKDIVAKFPVLVSGAVCLLSIFQTSFQPCINIPSFTQ